MSAVASESCPKRQKSIFRDSDAQQRAQGFKPLRPSSAFSRMKDAYIKMAIQNRQLEELPMPVEYRLTAEVRVELLAEHPIPNS